MIYIFKKKRENDPKKMTLLHKHLQLVLSKTNRIRDTKYNIWRSFGHGPLGLPKVVHDAHPSFHSQRWGQALACRPKRLPSELLRCEYFTPLYDSYVPPTSLLRQPHA